MKCLTLRPEYAAAVRWLQCDVACLQWRAPDDAIGQRIAIHAGKRFEASNSRDAWLDAGGALDYHYSGHAEIQKVGLNFDLVWTPTPCAPLRRERIILGAVVATAHLVEVVRDSASRWATPGAWHWVFADVQPAASALIHGHANLWDLEAVIIEPRRP